MNFLKCCELLPHSILPPKAESTETYIRHLVLKFYAELFIFLRVSLTSLGMQVLIKKGNHLTQQGILSREHLTVSMGPVMGTVAITKYKASIIPPLKRL